MKLYTPEEIALFVSSSDFTGASKRVVQEALETWTEHMETGGFKVGTAATPSDSSLKIVLLEGFTSSAVFQPSNQREFMGGAEFAAEFADADVVMATWPPEDRPIILRKPDNVEIVGGVWKHMYGPRMKPSVTGQEMDDEIHGRRP